MQHRIYFVVIFTSTSSAAESVWDTIHSWSLRAKTGKGKLTLHVWHCAFGIVRNSMASGGNGVRSNSSCKGIIYRVVFPAPEAVRIRVPVYPLESGGIIISFLLPWPPVMQHCLDHLGCDCLGKLYEWQCITVDIILQVFSTCSLVE